MRKRWLATKGLSLKLVDLLAIDGTWMTVDQLIVEVHDRWPGQYKSEQVKRTLYRLENAGWLTSKLVLVPAYQFAARHEHPIRSYRATEEGKEV